MIERTLISWVGKQDLSEFELGARGPLEDIIHQKEAHPQEAYARVCLISTWPKEKTESFIQHLDKKYKADIHFTHASISDPTSYGDIYQHMEMLLKRITTEYPNDTITLQLTSGTPQMTAVSLLLGKAKYFTEFIQSNIETGVTTPELPFDLTADFHQVIPANHKDKLSQLFVGEAPDTAEFADIITQSAEMETLKQKAAIIAKREMPVLITGETGTGKELFAKAIHASSDRKDKPMLTINCGAIPSDLIDSILFGHTKGAFTGANAAKEGYFSKANEGTLFLDEFGELPLDSQIRLLRVIQEGRITPVGTTNEISVDVRIIAATHKNLADEVANGRFREDLFYRIAVAVLHLPPLRNRTGDSEFVAKALLKQINASVNDENYVHKNFCESAIKFISKQSWNGNVRELQATIMRATLWQPLDKLTDKDLSSSLFSTAQQHDNIMEFDVRQGIDINNLIDKLKRHYVVNALKVCDGNLTKSSKLLGLKSYQTLDNWIKKYSIK